MNDHSIGKTIATLRKANGWTQVELAQKLNVSDKAVSKWESEAGFPEISQLPILAKLFDVSIDYLMTGKDNAVPLDDMDSAKRMLYLIEKDDAENYIKYDYPSKTYFDDICDRNSAITSIIENKSKKIFNACVKNGIALRQPSINNQTLVDSIYGHIDSFIKMACESDCLEFLQAIDFLSFAVGNKTLQSLPIGFKHTHDPQTAYLVSPSVFEFIFTNPNVSDRIINYVSSYKAFQPNAIHYGQCVFNYGEISGTFYFFEQNIIEQLYKTKRFDMLSDYIQQIELDTLETIKKYEHEKNECPIYTLQGDYLIKRDALNSTSTVLGKLITIDKKTIALAISNLDDTWAKTFVNYNRKIIDMATNGIMRYENKIVFAPNDEELTLLFEEAKQQQRIKTIQENTSLSNKQRREKLFAENALSVSDVLLADDYDLFAKFPEEKLDAITITDIVDADCADVRFYIHAANINDNINDMNFALKTILEKHPDRYDIMNVLLSVGASVDNNLAFTNILKQNVAIHLNEKDTTSANIEIDNDISKKSLLNSLCEGKCEYVIVNLTIVLEKKLKSMLSEQNMDLIDMIDKVHSNGMISDFDCKMLHNLRKARNGIVHQSGRFYYTEPIIKSWIKIVYSL